MRSDAGFTRVLGAAEKILRALPSQREWTTPIVSRECQAQFGFIFLSGALYSGPRCCYSTKILGNRYDGYIASVNAYYSSEILSNSSFALAIVQASKVIIFAGNLDLTFLQGMF